MGVGHHLGIRLADYDRAIRKFVPFYGEMLKVAAGALTFGQKPGATIIDLGIGTGALSHAILRRHPRAAVVGIEVDADMLPLARRRLGDRAIFIESDFERVALPRGDAIVAALALHHIRSSVGKRRLYRRCRAALRPHGELVIADCFPAAEPAVAAAQMDAWKAHLEKSFTPKQSRALLRRWAAEDIYLPLNLELDLLAGAGFTTEVIWRKQGFAVLRAEK